MKRTCVWVTGASSGIGKSLIRRATPTRAKLIGISRTMALPRCEQARDQTCDHIMADLSQEAGWTIVCDSIRAEFRSDRHERAILLHAAASVEPLGFAGEVDPAQYRRAILLNAVAPQVLGRCFIEEAIRAGIEARLVLLTAGPQGGVYPGWSSYRPSKAAIDAWVRIVGRELGSRGVDCRVLAVALGLVNTPMQERIRVSSEDAFPRRDRFVEALDDQLLRAPDDVADELWAIIERDTFRSGDAIELRGL